MNFLIEINVIVKSTAVFSTEREQSFYSDLPPQKSQRDIQRVETVSYSARTTAVPIDCKCHRLVQLQQLLVALAMMMLS